jgi:L-fuculose-phosphate aldolase
MSREAGFLCDPKELWDAEEKHRKEICRLGQLMYEHGLIVANEGNLSLRLSAEHILITPSGKCKGLLAPEELLVITLAGEIVCGEGQPSSETSMHIMFYRSRPDIHAICHAHPPTATGFAAAGKALEDAVLPEVIVGLGKVPLAPYATPGTREVCIALESLIQCHDAILLRNHGVVTCGGSLQEAYFRLETVEHFARIMLVAKILGGPLRLPHTEVEKLIQMRGTPAGPASLGKRPSHIPTQEFL